MCNFCETPPSNTVRDGKDHYFYEGYVIQMDVLDDCGSSNKFCTLKMNYCPICGRKLEEN